CTRPADTVARLAGDEFVVILERLQTVDLAISCANRIITALSEPVQLTNKQVNCTCSIGISLYPFGEDTVQSLIHKADTA
ncbi:MAG: GGDEF domain-containing protein, partial [Gammaproteobacteria bacterium]|nr:GGDEF domain-containing protein [Gammaproteobacteria bacterium]NIR96337.1 GGDEF domain-containing protein [Gammaproteobacteria bacterium]NIW45868.1 diguanylate cyclase [Gammaproteobacteria bacterium]NIW97577.1 diguanylate cyclase [Phycisphaerae bacterium]